MNEYTNTETLNGFKTGVSRFSPLVEAKAFFCGDELAVSSE